MTMGNDIGFTYAGDVSKEDIFGYHYGAFVLELTGDAEVGTLLGTTGGKAIVCGGESIALEEIFAAYENKLRKSILCTQRQRKRRKFHIHCKGRGYFLPRKGGSCEASCSDSRIPRHKLRI